MLLGVVPTPAVAIVSARDEVPGVVISASHNPFEDNGIKVFAPGGLKLTDAEQAEVEAAIAEVLGGCARRWSPVPRSVRCATTPAVRMPTPPRSPPTLEGRDLAGMRVVVDCANGANSQVAPEVLRALGAEVTVLSADPDGTNINARVRLHPPRRRCSGPCGPRAPRSASPSTATRTGWWRSTTPASWSTATRSSPCARSTWPDEDSSPTGRWS